ncbi:MAG: nuclear transport factor 2 family protein [Gammaproteobacteria bacterium]|nr:nuclear transport factor 2 family protein [Gammaproteobacteria bacterium]
MQQPDWVTELFHSIDNMDTRAFLNFLAPTARFRFANGPAVAGQDAIGDAVDGFFATIGACQHKLLDVWSTGTTVICRGDVTYTRLDDSRIKLPFVNVLGMNGEKIQEYSIYIDISPLYAGHA